MVTPDTPHPNYANEAHALMTLVPVKVFDEVFPRTHSRELRTHQVVTASHAVRDSLSYTALASIQPAIISIAEEENLRTYRAPNPNTLNNALHYGIGIGVSVSLAALKQFSRNPDTSFTAQAAIEGFGTGITHTIEAELDTERRAAALVHAAENSHVNYDSLIMAGHYALGTDNPVEKAVLQRNIQVAMAITQQAIATHLAVINEEVDDFTQNIEF